jgi:2-polyprenyl-3-methyl-5-hydroxy-6-metoxy-1,4-benzoquinol methylase
MDRIEQLRRGLTKSMKGLEIGPFFNPIVPRAEGWQTTIIDYTDKDGLLHRAADLNQPDVTALSAQIDDVDIVWRGEPLDELCLNRNPDGYDFLVASHVIEHIPDLIRFFQSLAPILKATGVLSLAVPDLRYCFDFYKPWTNTAKVLAARG